MVRNFICALLAVLLALPLASFIAAEDIPEVVEMPAVVTPMQTAQEETEADASEEASAPEEPSEDADEPRLAELFDEFRAARNLTEDNFAVSYYDTVTGESYDWNETHMMIAGSTFKLPLNLYYYELENAGEIAPDALITQGGATLDWCHYLSIVESNNEISHALLYRIGNFHDYKNAMRTYFTMTDEEIDPKYYQDNYYCTRMMMDTLKHIYEHQSELTELVDYMKQSHPQNGYFRAKVTEMEVAHKYGSFEGAENDVGIFYAERPFLLAVYTQNVGELVVQDAARLAADYNARQTELAKKQALQEQLDAFEAEKEARMQEAEARAEEAMQALTAQYEAEQTAKKAAQEAALQASEKALVAQADTQEAETAPEQTKASLAQMRTVLAQKCEREAFEIEYDEGYACSGEEQSFYIRRLLSIALSRQNENRQSDTEAPRKPDNSEKQAKTNVKTEKTSEKLAKAPEKANGKRNKKK